MEPTRRPGDFILDRYMPDAPPKERESARRRLYDFVGTLLRIAIRQDNERRTLEDSPDVDGRRRMNG
jgi:hypothetical protein